MRRLGDAEDALEVAYCGPLPGPSRRRGAALYVCGAPDRAARRRGVPSPFLLPGNARLSDKWDPEGSPGAAPAYRFEGAARRAAPAEAAEATGAPAGALLLPALAPLLF